VAILGTGGVQRAMWCEQVKPNVCVHVTAKSEQHFLVDIMGVCLFFV
jgi:hypothetical protein